VHGRTTAQAIKERKLPENKRKIKPMNEENIKKTPEEGEHIDEKEIGKVRHDEPVTVKGVARALLMADEPGQRMEVDKPESESAEK